jgi:hypothetical protein
MYIIFSLHFVSASIGTHATMSLAHIRLRISERYREAKDTWHADPAHHGTEEIPPPPPKKSTLDRVRNSIARTAAQIRTGHWSSAVYLKRIRKRETDHCWLCDGIGQNRHKMTRAHVLMNCRNPQVVAARAEAWGGGETPGSVWRLLADPRWEKRFVRFLELSGVGGLWRTGRTRSLRMPRGWIRGLRGRRKMWWKWRDLLPPGVTARTSSPLSTCALFLLSFFTIL